MLYNKWMLNIFLQTLKSTWNRIKNSRRVVVHIPSLGYTEDVRAQMYNFHVEQNNQIARICSISGKIILYLCPRALIQRLTFNNAIARNTCTCEFVFIYDTFFSAIEFHSFHWYSISSDPNVDVIYVSPITVTDEAKQYYHKLLSLKNAIDSGDMNDITDMNTRLTFVVPEVISHFGVSTTTIPHVGKGNWTTQACIIRSLLEYG